MKNRLTVAACAIALLSAALGTAARAQAVLQSEVGLCLQPMGGSQSWNGSLIQQVTCNRSDPSQLWRLIFVKSVNGVSWNQIRNEATHLCLDDKDGNTADHAPTQQWACNTTSTTMQWYQGRQDGANVMLVNNRSGKCLDVPQGEPTIGAIIGLYHCSPTLSGTSVINKAEFWGWN